MGVSPELASRGGACGDGSTRAPPQVGTEGLTHPEHALWVQIPVRRSWKEGLGQVMEAALPSLQIQQMRYNGIPLLAPN